VWGSTPEFPVPWASYNEEPRIPPGLGSPCLDGGGGCVWLLMAGGGSSERSEAKKRDTVGSTPPKTGQSIKGNRAAARKSFTQNPGPTIPTESKKKTTKTSAKAFWAGNGEKNGKKDAARPSYKKKKKKKDKLEKFQGISSSSRGGFSLFQKSTESRKPPLLPTAKRLCKRNSERTGTPSDKKSRGR